MKIDIIISANDIKIDKIKNKTVVIIDMLRATSVIVTALNNGCREIIPVINVQEALDIAKQSLGTYVLGGERNALKLDGFDFSNSPLDYTPSKIKDKTLIMTTTNGTRAIKNSIGAKNILISAMINAKATAEKIIKLNNETIIINAGTHGEFSIDDFICSGYLVNCILKKAEVELSDIAITANYIYTSNQENIAKFIKKAKHYNTLLNLGLKKDLDYCCQKDIINIVPEFINNKIK